MTDHSDLITVRCEGCGSAWTDADLARERAASPRLLSCCPERKPLTIDQWRARAEAQSLSLSEAREENERLRSALLVVRPVVAGLIDAQYNVERWGLKGRLAKLDSELRRERVCEVCGGDCSAANPPPSYCPERDDFSALENGSAVLADAPSNPPLSDLSSLRKGAEEIEVTDEMIEAGKEAANGWTDRYMDGAEFVNWDEALPEIFRRMLALVSGSREDGA